MTPDSENYTTDLLDDLDLDSAIGAATSSAEPVADIDLEAILEAAPEDEPSDCQPCSFDFDRPNRLSRQFEQNLLSVAENFAKIATIDFTNRLRVSMSVAFQSIRLVACDDYLERMPNPTCVARVTLEPLSGPCLVHLDLGICFVLLKKLMGGRADPDPCERGFTEIERGLFTDQIERLNDGFARACRKLVEIEPAVRGIENNPNYLTGMPSGESLVCFRYEIQFDTITGLLEIIVPLPGFGPVRDIFDPEQAHEQREAHEVRQDREKILDTIRETTSEVVVRLGEMPVSLAAIMTLKEGDVLTLRQAVTAPLAVEIAGREVYRGEAGRVGAQRAVKLTEKLSQE